MAKINTGGPAFPTEDFDDYYHGMDLRDWFAGMALQAYLACSAAPRAHGYDDYATTAYEMADAMLKARDVK